jgi:hypothetical protein
VIPTDLIIEGGATVLLAFVVWLIVTGRLVPRRALLDAQAERDKWAEAAEKAMQQNQELLTGARVARDVIKALPDPTAGERT